MLATSEEAATGVNLSGLVKKKTREWKEQSVTECQSISARVEQLMLKPWDGLDVSRA
jgi:hypothetical protein